MSVEQQGKKLEVRDAKEDSANCFLCVNDYLEFPLFFWRKPRPNKIIDLTINWLPDGTPVYLCRKHAGKSA